MSNELIDICFNFTHASFRKDESAVVERAAAVGVTTMLVTGSSAEESARGVELAERYPQHLYATAGVHPHMASSWDADTYNQLRALTAHPRVQAVGEAGLDYNRNYSSPADQRRAFERQIELACETRLPLFLHQRDAHEDFTAMLNRYRGDLRAAVVHCFTGDRAQLDDYLAMDLHIGITGWLCDERRGRHLHELVSRIPQDRLMVETDAPYLLPRDLRPRPEGRRNEPSFLPHIVRAIAACTGRSFEETAAAATATARRFYNLD